MIWLKYADAADSSHFFGSGQILHFTVIWFDDVEDRVYDTIFVKFDLKYPLTISRIFNLFRNDALNIPPVSWREN